MQHDSAEVILFTELSLKLPDILKVKLFHVLCSTGNLLLRPHLFFLPVQRCIKSVGSRAFWKSRMGDRRHMNMTNPPHTTPHEKYIFVKMCWTTCAISTPQAKNMIMRQHAKPTQSWARSTTNMKRKNQHHEFEQNRNIKLYQITLQEGNLDEASNCKAHCALAPEALDTSSPVTSQGSTWVTKRGTKTHPKFG